MRRVILAASLLVLLTLGALGTAAYADCTSCLTSVVFQRPNGGANVGLTFTARSTDGTALPSNVTAVVMQVDGQRTKCAGLTLLKTSEFEGLAVYSGNFTAYGSYSHSGRVDLGGQIYDFVVPLDGKPGTIAVATDQTPLRVNGPAVRITAAPAAPIPAASASRPTVELPEIQPAFLIGAAVVLLTIVGAYVDRRRALARSLTA